jgi:hypothetical protein
MGTKKREDGHRQQKREKEPGREEDPGRREKNGERRRGDIPGTGSTGPRNPA